MVPIIFFAVCFVNAGCSTPKTRAAVPVVAAPGASASGASRSILRHRQRTLTVRWPLKNHDAVQLASVLRQIFEPKGSLPGKMVVVRIAADAKANALVVTGNAAAIAAIRRLLAPPVRAEGPPVAVIPLYRLEADAVARRLSGRFGSQTKIKADKPTNSLIVVSPTRGRLANVTRGIRGLIRAWSRAGASHRKSSRSRRVP